MKKLLIVLLSCVSVSAFSQTVEEVIQKYSTAMGGLEAFNKIKTAKMDGTVTDLFSTMPLTIELINGKAVKTKLTKDGRDATRVYNNGEGWKMEGFSSPTDLSSAELARLKLQSTLANSLMDYKSRGHKVELMGQEDVKGINTYKIKLTTKDDKVTFYFINMKTGLLSKSATKLETASAEYDIDFFYSDFRELNGLTFCFKIVMNTGSVEAQVTKYTSIQLDVPVDEAIFVKPRQAN
ncbi:MAG TPA: hypothetical protein VGO58_05060 [Chitinophagaceae bacterium]|jgi:hypothetical protein|nr:hypothetical protein [Chitinophagaceae bacterium]